MRSNQTQSKILPREQMRDLLFHCVATISPHRPPHALPMTLTSSGLSSSRPTREGLSVPSASLSNNRCPSPEGVDPPGVSTIPRPKLEGLSVPAHHCRNDRRPNPEGVDPPLAQDEVLGSRGKIARVPSGTTGRVPENSENTNSIVRPRAERNPRTCCSAAPKQS